MKRSISRKISAWASWPITWIAFPCIVILGIVVGLLGGLAGGIFEAFRFAWNWIALPMGWTFVRDDGTTSRPFDFS